MKYILVFLFLSSGLYSQDYVPLQEVDAFKAKIAEVTENTNTLQSSFTQTKVLSFMTDPILTEGAFKYKKPNLIRWEYTSPFSYILIINDDKIMIDDEGNQNEIDLSANEMFKQINNIISDALLGKVLDNSEQFSHQLFSGQNNFKIILTPIDQQLGDFIETVEVYFDKDEYIVSETIMYEPGGDYTKIVFENKQLNDQIDNLIFELK